MLTVSRERVFILWFALCLILVMSVAFGSAAYANTSSSWMNGLLTRHMFVAEIFQSSDQSDIKAQRSALTINTSTSVLAQLHVEKTGESHMTTLHRTCEATSTLNESHANSENKTCGSARKEQLLVFNVPVSIYFVILLASALLLKTSLSRVR